MIRVNTEAPAGKHAPCPAKKETDSPRILAADDEADLRQLSLTVLLGAGYQVDTADDGDMAWEMLQTATYDLLITDNRMPKLSGVELIGKLNAAGMTLPVILASGTPPDNVESLPLAAILLKPFLMRELLQTVKDVFFCQPSDAATPKLRIIARQLLAQEKASPPPPQSLPQPIPFARPCASRSVKS